MKQKRKEPRRTAADWNPLAHWFTQESVSVELSVPPDGYVWVLDGDGAYSLARLTTTTPGFSVLLTGVT